MRRNSSRVRSSGQGQSSSDLLDKRDDSAHVLRSDQGLSGSDLNQKHADGSMRVHRDGASEDRACGSYVFSHRLDVDRPVSHFAAVAAALTRFGIADEGCVNDSIAIASVPQTVDEMTETEVRVK